MAELVEIQELDENTIPTATDEEGAKAIKERELDVYKSEDTGELNIAVRREDKIDPKIDTKDTTTTKSTEEQIKFVDDAATVSKPIIRPKPKKKYDTSAEPQVGFTQGPRTLRGITSDPKKVEDTDFKAGLDTTFGIGTSDFQQRAKQSLQDQEAGVTKDDLLTSVQTNKPIAGLSKDEMNDLNLAYDILLEPTATEAEKTQANKTLETLTEIINETRQDQDKVKFSFDAGGEFKPSKKAEERLAVGEDALYDQEKIYFESRKELAKIVKGVNPNLPKKQQTIVEQILVDNVTTGEFFDTMIEGFNEDTRAIGIVLPNMIYNGVRYGTSALLEKMFGDKTFSEAYAESAQDRAKDAQAWKEYMRDYMDIKVLSETMNDMIHETLKIKLDKNEITQETYDSLTKSDIQDEEGNFLKKQLISEDKAQAILNESISQLSSGQRFIMLALGNFAGMGGLALKQSTKGATKLSKLEDKVSSARGSRTIDDIAQGKGKYADMSVIERAAALRKEGIEINFNHKLIGQALREQQISETFQKMKKKRDKLAKEIANLEDANIPNLKTNPKYVKLKQEYESIKGKVFRNYWYGRTNPIFRESVFLTTPATIMQWGATEIFSQTENPLMDFYTAQGAGALFHMVTSVKFGRGFIDPKTGTSIQDVVTNVVKYPFAQMKEATSSYMDVVGIARIPGFDVLRSKDLEEYNKMVLAARGTRLTRKERIAAKYIMDLAAVLPEARVKQMLKSIKNQVKLEEDIISMFPKDERAEIREIITAPFAQASGLVWLKSAYSMAGSTGIRARDLKDFQKLEDLQKINDATALQLQFAERAIQNLKKLRGRDVEDPEALNKLITKYENTFAKEANVLTDQKQAILNDFTDLNASIYENPDVDITPELANQMLNTGVKARMDLDPLLSEGEALQKQVEENYKLLSKRSDIINSNLRSGKTLKRSGTQMEEVFDLHLQDMIADARIPYKELDKLAKEQGKTVDVSDLLRKLHKTATEISQESFTGFFSKEGKFFNSPLNQKLKVSMENMARRYLNSLPKKTADKLYKAATTQGSRHYIGEPDDIDFIDVALYWQAKDKTGKFKAFKALPSEVTEVYTAFRDYSFRSKKTDPAMGEKFEGMASDVSNLVKKFAPEYHTKWKAANLNYQKKVFERLDGDGPLTDFVNSKSDRVLQITKIGKEQTKFKNLYKKGQEPDKLLDKFAGSINKYLGARGSEDDLIDVQNYFANFNRQMTEIIDDQFVFDLTTEKGLNKYKALKGAVQSTVYSKWAKGVLDRYEKLDPRIAAQLKREDGGYNFKQLDADKLDELSEATMVKIKTADGIKPQPLINLKKLISDEKDIVKLMKRDKKAREAYKVFKNTSNDKIKAIQNAELERLQKRDFVLEKFSELTKMDDNAFYDRYILRGDANGIAKLESDLAKKGVEKEDFKDFVLTSTIKGFLKRGKPVVIADEFLDMPNGAKVAVRGFDTPEVMVADLSNDRIVGIFNKLIGEEHTTYLRNFTSLLAKQKKSEMNIQAITGVVRPISDNELISRAFNLARGMVSPTYVGAEFALRIASGAGIDMIKLAAGNKEASRLMAQMLEFPETLTKADISRMNILIKDFVITELAQMGQTIPDMFFENLAQQANEEQGDN